MADILNPKQKAAMKEYVAAEYENMKNADNKVASSAGVDRIIHGSYPDLTDFPIQGIGINEKIGYFCDRANRTYMKFTEQEIKKSPITFLINKKNMEIALNTFPHHDKEGNIAAIATNKMAAALWDQAAKNQNFNEQERMRGLGLWRDSKGHLIINLGDRLYFKPNGMGPIRDMDNGWHDGYFYFNNQSHQITSEIINQANIDKKFDRLEYEAAFKAVSKKLDLWRFQSKDGKNQEEKIFQKVILGWLYCAVLGGANNFRPHLWITGQTGAGKSTLANEIFEKTLAGFGKKSDDATEAGLRGQIKNGNIPFIIDEAEPKSHSTRLTDLIELARKSSSGGMVTRGTPSGGVVIYPIRSCFIFLSIGAPPLAAQDLSRILILSMAKANSEKAHQFQTKLKSGNPFALDFSISLTAILKNWEHYQPIYKKVFKMLVDAGTTSRIADFYASIFTPYLMAEHNTALTEMLTDKAIQSIEHVFEVIKTELIDIIGILKIQKVIEVKAEQKMLNTILDHKVSTQTNQRIPVGRLLSAALGSVLTNDTDMGHDSKCTVGFFVEKAYDKEHENDAMSNELFRDKTIKERVMKINSVWETALIALNDIGINIKIRLSEETKMDEFYLCIADSNDEFKKEFYANTDMRTDFGAVSSPWEQELGKIPGAITSIQVRFRTSKNRRCTLIPFSSLDISVEVSPIILELVKKLYPAATATRE